MLGRMGGTGEWSINRINEDSKFCLVESSSSAGSSKKARAPGNITHHMVSCLVDGCNSDLSQGREYHRRHKVCEIHSKTAKVTIGGREQRFCQQCSRFHSLVEFDEGKRSCRKRLDGHNRRRRKPQSESLSRNTGRFLSNQQGTTLLSFSGPQLLPSAIMNSAWAGAIKAENSDGGSGSSSGVQYSSHQQLNYIDRHGNFPAHSFGGGNHFKIYQDNDGPISQPFLDPNSDCALSLLSSAPAETREIGSSHVVHPIHNMHYCDLSQFSQGLENKPVVSVLNSFVGDNDANANLHCQGMFQNGPDGPSSSASGPHQTLSSRWM